MNSWFRKSSNWFILFSLIENPAAKLCPPPLIIIFLSIAFLIYKPMLKSSVDLTEALYKLLEYVKTIQGLFK